MKTFTKLRMERLKSQRAEALKIQRTESFKSKKKLTGIKILTPNKLITRLPVLLA